MTPRHGADARQDVGGHARRQGRVRRRRRRRSRPGRYHSLVIADEGLPPEIEVAARTREDGIIMAVRHTTYPVHGVQFHPESVLTDDGRRMLRNFLDLLMTAADAGRACCCRRSWRSCCAARTSPSSEATAAMQDGHGGAGDAGGAGRAAGGAGDEGRAAARDRRVRPDDARARREAVRARWRRCSTPAAPAATAPAPSTSRRRRRWSWRRAACASPSTATAPCRAAAAAPTCSRRWACTWRPSRPWSSGRCARRASRSSSRRRSTRR